MAFGVDDALAIMSAVSNAGQAAFGAGQSTDPAAAARAQAQQYEMQGRTAMQNEQNQALALLQRLQSAPLRDQAQYLLGARLGLTPQNFQGRNFWGTAAPNTQPSQGGVDLSAYQAAQNAYRPGMGGISDAASTSLQQKMISNLGYNQGTNGQWNYTGPVGFRYQPDPGWYYGTSQYDYPQWGGQGAVGMESRPGANQAWQDRNQAPNTANPKGYQGTLANERTATSRNITPPANPIVPSTGGSTPQNPPPITGMNPGTQNNIPTPQIQAPVTPYTPPAPQPPAPTTPTTPTKPTQPPTQVQAPAQPITQQAQPPAPSVSNLTTGLLQPLTPSQPIPPQSATQTSQIAPVGVNPETYFKYISMGKTPEEAALLASAKQTSSLSTALSTPLNTKGLV